MGMFSDIFSGGKEKRTQLYFRDDGSFEFRKLEFEDTCLVEKKDNEVIKAWKHFFGPELIFNGYKNIHADMVTLCFDRDFILDPFDAVPVVDNPQAGKPARNEHGIRSWTAQVAEAQRYKVVNKPGSSLLVDKISMFLGIALIIMLLILGMSKAWG